LIVANIHERPLSCKLHASYITQYDYPPFTKKGRADTPRYAKSLTFLASGLLLYHHSSPSTTPRTNCASRYRAARFALIENRKTGQSRRLKKKECGFNNKMISRIAWLPARIL